MRGTAILLALVALLPYPALPVQATADARDILKRTGDTYRQMKSYQFEGTFSNDQRGGDARSFTEGPVILAGVRPNRYRIEFKTPFGGGSLRVSDGVTFSQYNGFGRQYSRHPVASMDASDHLGPSADFVYGYERITDRLKQARVIREETLAVGGAATPCWVIEAEYDSPVGPPMASASLKTYWVDKTRTVIVRESSERKQRLMGTPVTSSILLAFSVVKVNQPVPDTLFAFVPPEGAREVEAFGPPGMPRRSSQINREAPEAIFRNLDGQSVSLKTYRGKVIFLVYWASWSNPSREEMALVEKLYREHKDKGLVLLAVDYGEDASVVKSYLEKNETAATVLLDPDRQIARLFDISSVPNAIFISREGKIVAIESGFGPRTEEHLRAALKDSGLN